MRERSRRQTLRTIIDPMINSNYTEKKEKGSIAGSKGVPWMESSEQAIIMRI